MYLVCFYYFQHTLFSICVHEKKLHKHTGVKMSLIGPYVSRSLNTLGPILPDRRKRGISQGAQHSL